MITIVLLTCVLVAVYLKLSARYRRMMELAEKVPVYPGCLPLIGHGHKFLGLDGEAIFDLLKSITDYAQSNGGICVAYLNMRPHFAITDPDSAYTVLNEALDKSYMYKFLSPWLGDGLFTADAATWHPNRKMLSPAFNPGVISSFQSVFEKQSRKLTYNLKSQIGKGPFDPSKYLQLCFLETVYETALGSTEEEQVVDEDYALYSHKMFVITIQRILNTHFHFDFIFNWSRLKQDQDGVVKILHEVSNRVIEKRKSEFNNNDQYSGLAGQKFKPFLKHILELNSDNAYTDCGVREEVDTIILAGQDTSSLVMQYILIMLGSHQTVQEKLYAEIHEVFANEDRDVTKEDMSKMKYAEAVIHETLRMYPIGCLVPRDVNRDLKLRDYTIPAGSTAMISFWGLHRNKNWGPDAEVFKPERWLDPSTLPDLKTNFGGFSLGKRNCIGKSYALAAMKTVLVHLLKTYRIHSDASKLKLSVDIMLRPASGDHISIELR